MVLQDIPSEMSKLLQLIGGLGWLPSTSAGGESAGSKRTRLSGSLGSFIRAMIKPLCLCLPSAAHNNTHLISIVFKAAISQPASPGWPRHNGFVCLCVCRRVRRIDRRSWLYQLSVSRGQISASVLSSTHTAFTSGRWWAYKCAAEEILWAGCVCAFACAHPFRVFATSVTFLAYGAQLFACLFFGIKKNTSQRKSKNYEST